MSKTKYDNIYSYKIKAGTRYMYRVTYYDNAHIRREHSKRGFKTAKEAYRASLEILVDKADEHFDYINNRNLNMSQLFDLYLKDKQDAFAPSTLESYQIIARKAKKLIGHIKVRDLKKLPYKALFLDEIEKSGYTQNTMRTYHKWIEATVNWAVDNDLVDKNRIKGFTFDIKSERNKMMSPKVIGEFLSYLDDNKQDKLDDWFIFNFLLRTGVRKGEMLALRWCDISDNGKVIISKTRGKFGVRQQTKTGRNREIYLGKTLSAMFKEYKAEKQKAHLRRGKPFRQEDLMITSDVLLPVGPEGINTRLHNINDKMGTQRYTVHSLRHANATLSLSSDNNIKAVQTRLGHSDSTTTMKYYVEEMDDISKDYADSIDDLFNTL